MLVLLGGWALLVVFGILYYLLRNVMTPAVFLVCLAVVLLVVTIAMLGWICKKGVRIFDSL